MFNVSAARVQLKVLTFLFSIFLTGLFHNAYICIGRKNLPSAIDIKGLPLKTWAS